MHKALFFILLTGALAACNRQEEPVAMNSPSKPLAQLEKEALAGNVASYNEMQTGYLDFRARDRSLLIPLIMANKNNYYPAYVDAFYIMLDGYSEAGYAVKDIGRIDAKTRRFLIECLEQASKGQVAEADSLLLAISRIDHGKYYRKQQ